MSEQLWLCNSRHKDVIDSVMKSEEASSCRSGPRVEAEDGEGIEISLGRRRG